MRISDQTPAYASDDRIDSPAEGSNVSGRVEVRGTASADGANFRSFRLEFGPGRSPASWQPIGPERDHSVKSGVLGIWDTSDLAAAEYSLRLTVFDEAGHASESWVRVKITPSALVQAPVAVPPPTADPSEPIVEGPDAADESTVESASAAALGAPNQQGAPAADSPESDGPAATDEESVVGSVIQPVPPEPRPLPGAPIRCPMLYYHEVPSRLQLAAQLTAFLRAGYRPLTMGRLVDALDGRAEPTSGCLVLTFDDGLASQVNSALPVLAQYGVPATFFVMPGFQDGVHRYMTARHLRSLRAGGMEIGSHTLNHANLPALLRVNYGAFQSEIMNSKLLLEDELGEQVDLLAYPNGAWDHPTAVELWRAGYRAAASTMPGTWHRAEEVYWLRRLRADPWEAPGTVLARLAG